MNTVSAMSLRGTKRATGVRGDEAGSSKRRRTEPEDALWQIRSVSDLKMSSIYNRSASEAPAELFRKDLISAMKLPDSEPLTPNEYWVITDTWKQDWERGVQVPVNPDSLPAPIVKVIDNPLPPNFQEFKLPKDKYIHLNGDAYYLPDQHQLSTIPARAEACCTYDLDATDTAWLKLLNSERARAGAPPITEDQLEKVIEELEVRCWDKIQAIMKSEEKLGIEYDENVICDVCRSPDSEEGNEMVFCDSCNICVHQACYGITTIPSGQWLCRPCSATRHNGTRPTCVLCPNLGGAMKCTPSGHKWAHVSCVLWIPEVSIGCAENMEPITKISAIPASRWSLVCVLCRERKGACIQCSVKTCKTAYHVTCAFKHGLEMRAIIEDENADDGVKLRSYCQKHSVNSKKDKCAGSGSEDDEIKRKRRKDMTSEEKNQARAAKLQEIESEFDRHVSVKDISTHLLDVDQDAIFCIYNYWKLKRRSGHNRPLLPPKADDSDILSHRQEQADLDKMKMFVQLRQDLERVRNLCYMVSRREKLSRSFFRMREQTFHKQVAVLSNEPDLSGPALTAIVEANHGPSIYDRLYSHPDAPDHKNDFEVLLSRIAGFSESSDEKKKDLNGLIKSSRSTSNPYKKVYVNGSSRRSDSMYSGLSSEESAPEIHRSTKYRNKTLGSSTDDDSKPITSPKKKSSPSSKEKSAAKKSERKKRIVSSRTVIESSSEEEIKPSIKKDKSRSATLRQLEKEMTAVQSGTESDDLMPVVRLSRNNKFPVDIYSDSSENSSLNKVEGFSTDKSPNATNDSQQQLPRTKAAMKEFVPIQKTVKEEIAGKKRGRKPSTYKEKSRDSDEEAKDKENLKLTKGKDYPSELIVPQRQAAKKASENMRSNTNVKIKDSVEQTLEKPSLLSDESKTKTKPKIKTKDKDSPTKESSKKKSSTDSPDIEKDDKDLEPIAYVPQRQAAKKAAAHIKSGLGNKFPISETSDDSKKKDNEKSDIIKRSPKKEDEKRAKTPSKTSSSSSSNSSSSSYSSSSSSENDEKSESKTPKAREVKPQTAKETSLFSPPGSRPTVDLPFLDKVSRPLSSTSASSDTDSSKTSRLSGSRSPSPKRIRPRRKETSSVSDAPRKAPDKKLKTSERRTEYGHSTQTAQGEEQSRTSDARAATRSRTRSTTSSGNMSNKSDARPRKPSKDEPNNSSAKTKTGKESIKSSELPLKERKEDETLEKKSKFESSKHDTIKIDEKCASKQYKLSADKRSSDEVEKVKGSPTKSMALKHKIASNRRMSVKETVISTNTTSESSAIDNKSNKYNIHNKSDFFNKKLSPSKMANTEKSFNIEKKSTPERVSDDLSASTKHWFPKAPSPTISLPAVERPGGNDKYITEDKSFDSDSADKSSVKMIAKIQATLNENTMIKSPKTPMDARTINIEPIDVDMPMSRNIRKRSIVDPDKKFIIQDTSHVQGVEISKSAKIPSAVSAFTNRCMFSPQPKDNELFEFDMLSVEDGFNHEEIIKPFTYSEFFFKEDSKEDRGVQETLNLVEKLRMTLSSKKPPLAENTTPEEPICNNDKNIGQHSEDASKSLQMNVDVAISNKSSDIDIDNKQIHENNTLNLTMNHISHHTPEMDVINDSNHENRTSSGMQVTNNLKWAEMPLQDNSRHDQANSDKYLGKEYNSNMTYNEDTMKDTEAPEVEMQSISELDRDRDTISKQSDDSQSLSVVDHSVHSNDQESMTNDNQNYDNNNSMIHSDCATISSPYVDSHDSKWRESKITHRRSSASSTNSDTSICSRKTGIKSRIDSCDSHQTNVMPDMDAYNAMPSYCPMEPIPLNPYSVYAPDPSQYLSTMSPVSVFPPGACSSSQRPLPSPGVGLFSSTLDVSYSVPPLSLPSIPKPVFPLSAAFTSSSQNIALTTAMIAPPTPKPVEQSPRDDIDIGTDKYSLHHTPSPTVSVDSYNETSINRHLVPKHNTENNESIITTSQAAPEPKSPIKQFKTATKFISQQIKSPGKSPGISPKQSKEGGASKRSTAKNSRGQRGRGRSKSRGHGYSSSNVDYLGNSIQSKLVGTVYDFDEEIANDGVDLKALRERRKSVDIHEKKSENSFKDASQSPQCMSSGPHTKRVPPLTESKEIRVPTPATDIQASGVSTSSPKSSADHKNFSPVVQPVLPGPVDMRTYQSFETAANTGEPYHSHLLAFASGTADQQLADIDEEVEKQLHSALAASKPPTSPKDVADEPVAHSISKPAIIDKAPAEMPLPKVSLSDSRNQLKVKIKGPFLDANYATSSVQPVAPPPVVTLEPSNSMLGTPSTVGSSSIMSGTTNLRRMRKKELLRQYWTQDMNMDEPTNNPSLGSAPPPAAQPLLTRAVITIPKAVASMTSIPTREDYRGVSDSNLDKKKRRTTSGLSRELRHLEVSMNDVDNAEEARVSNCSSTSGQMYSQKRRGRISNKPSKPLGTSQLAPKLKIKIGSGFVQPVNAEEPSGFQFRPPKKRIASMQKPTLEDLRRENMKYRRMVMAHFEEDEKTKKHKPKGEKRKKKKDKKSEKLQVVNCDSESTTKLVIKIKRTKDDTSALSEETAGASSSAVVSTSTAARARAAGSDESGGPVVDPFEYDPTAPDPLAIDPPSYAEASSAMRKIRTAKVTPIRLKLSRSAEGSGYVMKDPSGQPESVSAPEATSSSQALSLTVNKHCEVR